MRGRVLTHEKIHCISNHLVLYKSTHRHASLLSLCAANKSGHLSLSFTFLLLIRPLECRDVWFQLRGPCMLHAVGTALKPHCQLERSHFDPRRFILIWYTVYRVQKRKRVWYEDSLSACVMYVFFTCVPASVIPHKRYESN